MIISFSDLRDVTLRSKSLVLVQELLTLIRLPIIADLAAMVENIPSREEFSPFLVCMQTSSIGHIFQGLQLYQWTPFLGLRGEGSPKLGLEDLRPCMALSNRCLDLISSSRCRRRVTPMFFSTVKPRRYSG